MRSAYRKTPSPIPNARTPTIATLSLRIGGCSAALRDQPGARREQARRRSRSRGTRAAPRARAAARSVASHGISRRTGDRPAADVAAPTVVVTALTPHPPKDASYCPKWGFAMPQHPTLGSNSRKSRAGSCGDSGGLEGEHDVAGLDEAGAVGDDDDRGSAAASRRTAATTSASASSSRPAVGSSSRTSGRRVEQHPGQRHASALPGGHVAGEVAHAGGGAVRAAWRGRGRPRAGRRRPRRRVASGRRRRTSSATVGPTSTGSCATTPSRARQASGSRSARSASPTCTAPEVGATNAWSTASSVDLPTPEGPTTAVTGPARS